MKKKILHVWTDGGCWPNPGNGAWAFIIAKTTGEVIAEGSGFEEGVTNNRMEYTGPLKAFAKIRELGLDAQYDEFVIHSDSRLLCDTVNEWMEKWKANGWYRRSAKKRLPIANLDLVQELDRQKLLLNYRMQWVKGHAGIFLNERCDQLCTAEFNKRGLKSFEQLRDEGKLFVGGKPNVGRPANHQRA